MVALYDINVDTCRYASYLAHAVKCNSINNISNLEDKYNTYNTLYPYIYQQIAPQDRDFFAKLVNYLTFENENYSIYGYSVTGENGTCSYDLYSKAETIKRHELFNKVRQICDNRKPAKNIGYFGDYSNFAHAFLGGSGVSENDEFKERRIKALKDIMSNDLFINWKFSGLKTDEEKQFKLPSNNDTLKSYGFSENSFFVLSYFVNHLCKISNQEARDTEKSKLLSKILKLIPVNEVTLFNKILNYFTDGFADSLNANPKFINIRVLINTEDNVFWHTFENVSSLSDISSDEMIKAIKYNTPVRYRHALQETLDALSEDNLHDYIHIAKYYFEINIFLNNFSYFPKYKAKRIYNVDLENSKEYLPLIFEDILNAVNPQCKPELNIIEINNKINTENKIANTAMNSERAESVSSEVLNSSRATFGEVLKVEETPLKYEDYNLFDLLFDLDKDSDDNKNDNLTIVDSTEKQVNVLLNFEEDGQLSFAI